MTAEDFIKQLKKYQTANNRDKINKFFWGNDNTLALGVKFGDVFKLAKGFTKMPLDEIEKLLESQYYEVRMGAVSIMDFQARAKGISKDKHKALYDLYIRKHNRINNWDFVDRAAPYVVGGYLWDKPRDSLYTLAHSDNVWERRTAIVSTYFFIREGDLDDTFKIAEILISDEHELINKAVGSWLREAGKKDAKALKTFLDKYASVMPRVTLRYAIQKLDDEIRNYYMDL